MLWLPQLRLDLAEHSLCQFLLRRPLLRMVDQLEDERADRPLEPPSDTEVFAVLYEVTVELAEGVSWVFM